MKELILNEVSDLASNFVYYDRKEDNELSASDLEKAIKNGDITIDEIAEKFKNVLKESFS